MDLGGQTTIRLSEQLQPRRAVQNAICSLTGAAYCLPIPVLIHCVGVHSVGNSLSFNSRVMLNLFGLSSDSVRCWLHVKCSTSGAVMTKFALVHW